MLNEDTIEKLFVLAEKYANIKNLDSVEYINGMIEPMIASSFDVNALVRKLISYHEEWIGKF